MHAAAISAVAGEDDQGSFLSLSTDRVAQSVSLNFPGWLADDNWFHLAPGAPRIIRLRPHGGNEAALAGEIRHLGAPDIIAI